MIRALGVMAALAAPLAAEVVPPITPLSIIDSAIADGRLEAAQDLIQRSPIAADDPQLLLRQAELALAAGRLPEAATLFTELQQQASVAAQAHQGLGLARLRQGDVAAAVVALEAAVAADPTLVRAHLARGVAADRVRDWPASDGAYGRALALDPRSAAAYSNRGYSLMLRGQHTAAEADLLRAVALDPQSKLARTNLRLARAMQGKYKEAFKDSTREDLASDLNTVGFAAMARGDFVTAETYFARSQKLNPRHDPVVAANLAWLKVHAAPIDKQR